MSNNTRILIDYVYNLLYFHKNVIFNFHKNISDSFVSQEFLSPHNLIIKREGFLFVRHL